MINVLVFGEDHTDREALSELVRAITTAKGISVNTRSLRKPIVLNRNALRPKRKQVADEIAAFSAGFERSGKTYVVVHRDCDSVEPAHETNEAELEAELTKAGVARPIAATPAWEIESWWMLFLEALRRVRPSWRSVDYGRQHVGAIENAKERLRADLRPNRSARARVPDFEPCDAIRVAGEIRRDPTLLVAITARSDSFRSFEAKLGQIAA